MIQAGSLPSVTELNVLFPGWNSYPFLFAHHPNQLFTYEQLYDNIWKQPINESRHNLQARIGKVRKKLCDICPEKEYIRTIRHKGYLFVP
ncbi:MAG: helix-turn-helix domain-containing protein [Eisenbergiella sp.]